MPPKAKPASSKTGGKKVAPKPAGPGAIAAGGGLDVAGSSQNDEASSAPEEQVESFTATGIDNALDLLEVVNAKTDKASVGQQAANIEKHPEVRFFRSLCVNQLWY